MMIDLEEMWPATRMALPEPWRQPVWMSRPAGGGIVCHYAGAESGRVWRLDIGHGLNVGRTPATIGPDEREVVAQGAGRIAVSREAGGETAVRVLDIETGRVLHERPGGAMCLLPDGSALLAFGDEQTEIVMLDEPTLSRTSRLFQSDDAPLFGYQPHSAAAVARPGDDDVHIVVGHHGFTLDYRLRRGGRDPAGWQLASAPRAVAGLVLDPVDVACDAVYPWVALTHGYGTGLQVHHVESGLRLDCPSPGGRAYGTFGAGRLQADGRVLVPRREGWRLWSPAESISTALCPSVVEPVGLDDGSIWALRLDQPGAIWRL